METLTIEQHCERVRQYLALLPPDNQAGLMQITTLGVNMGTMANGDIEVLPMAEDDDIVPAWVLCIDHKGCQYQRRLLLYPLSFQRPMADQTLGDDDKIVKEELVTYRINGYALWLQTRNQEGYWTPQHAALTQCTAESALEQVSTECVVCSQLALAETINKSKRFAYDAMLDSRVELKREPMPEELKRNMPGTPDNRENKAWYENGLPVMQGKPDTGKDQEPIVVPSSGLPKNI